MTLRNIGLIFRREVVDQFRDRRTLFMIAVLPVLLYPALGIGMVQMTVLFSEQPRTVVILDADQLPPPELLDGSHFAPRWFANPHDAEKLIVITDRPDDQAATAPESAAEPTTKDQALAAARAMQALLQERQTLPPLKTDAASDKRRYQIREELGALFRESRFQVLLVVPDDFRDYLAHWRSSLEQRGRAEAVKIFPRPIILENSADEKSMIAHARVMEVIQQWEREILQAELATAGLPQTLPTPIHVEEIDLAQKEQLSANMWSKLFPALLVIMALTGAFNMTASPSASAKKFVRPLAPPAK